MNVGWLLWLFLLPMLGAVLVFYLCGIQRRLANNISMLIMLAISFLFLLLGQRVLTGEQLMYVIPEVCGWGLSFKLDGFRLIFGLLTSFAWLVTTWVIPEQIKDDPKPARYQFFNLMTLGATLGVFLSADFFTTYVFFEIMTMASFVLIIHTEDAAAQKAAVLYLFFGIVGGFALLMGLAQLYQLTGTLAFDELRLTIGQMADQRKLWLPGLLIFFGFAVKAGVFPVHVTLAPAYDAAPTPVSAILSAILSKTGVFGLVLVSIQVFFHQKTWGIMLVVLGLLTMYGGAILALFSTRLKRILAYSSMSQIGFILLGIGMQGLLADHNALAVRGSLLHMINHSVIKLTLFLAIGSIGARLKTPAQLDLNQLRGYGKCKPLLNTAFLLGVLGISGVPFFSGYISKTLLHESIVEYLHLLPATGAMTNFFRVSEALFLLAGGLTVAYMLKIYVAIFIEERTMPIPVEAEGNQVEAGRFALGYRSSIAMLVVALLIPLGGSWPQLMDSIATLGEGFMLGSALNHEVAYFAWINLKGAVISLGLGILVYLFVVRRYLMQKDVATGQSFYPSLWSVHLDLTTGFYQPLLSNILPAIGFKLASIVFQIGEKSFASVSQLTRLGIYLANRLYNLADSLLQGVYFLVNVGIYLAGHLFFFIEVLVGNLMHFIQYLITRSTEKGASYVKYQAQREGFQQFMQRIAAQRQMEDKAERRRIWQRISGSISYSLMLFGVGILIAMIYLLNVQK